MRLLWFVSLGFASHPVKKTRRSPGILFPADGIFILEGIPVVLGSVILDYLSPFDKFRAYVTHLESNDRNFASERLIPIRNKFGLKTRFGVFTFLWNLQRPEIIDAMTSAKGAYKMIDMISSILSHPILWAYLPDYWRQSEVYGATFSPGPRYRVDWGCLAERRLRFGLLSVSWGGIPENINFSKFTADDAFIVLRAQEPRLFRFVDLKTGYSWDCADPSLQLIPSLRIAAADSGLFLGKSIRPGIVTLVSYSPVLGIYACFRGLREYRFEKDELGEFRETGSSIWSFGNETFPVIRTGVMVGIHGSQLDRSFDNVERSFRDRELRVRLIRKGETNLVFLGSEYRDYLVGVFQQKIVDFKVTCPRQNLLQNIFEKLKYGSTAKALPLIYEFIDFAPFVREHVYLQQLIDHTLNGRPAACIPPATVSHKLTVRIDGEARRVYPIDSFNDKEAVRWDPRAYAGTPASKRTL